MPNDVPEAIGQEQPFTGLPKVKEIDISDQCKLEKGEKASLSYAKKERDRIASITHTYPESEKGAHVFYSIENQEFRHFPNFLIQAKSLGIDPQRLFDLIYQYAPEA